MATLVQSTIDLIDMLKASGTSAGDIIEVMNDTSQNVMDDWLWQEANGDTEHQRLIRTGLSKPAWLAMYEGIPQSKSSTQMVKDTMGFVQDRASMDTRMIEVYGPKANDVRLAEAAPKIEGMAQELVSAMFYHNPDTNLRLPRGLSPRYAKLGTTGSFNQVVDGGGTGSDNCSIWFVTWGYHDLSVIYPKGTNGGIKQEDKGEQRVLDENGNPYYVLEEIFTAFAGFSVGDWRNIARIANIDVSDLNAGTIDIYDLLARGYNKLHGPRFGPYVKDQKQPGRTVIYMNRTVFPALDKAMRTGPAGAANWLTSSSTIEGKMVWSYRGIPIRPTDSLLSTEARVVA